MAGRTQRRRKTIYIYSAYSEADKEKFPLFKRKAHRGRFQLKFILSADQRGIDGKSPGTFEAAETALRLLREKVLKKKKRS